MAGDSDWLDSSSYPNKRLKSAVIPEAEPNQESSRSMEELHSTCCGICLLEEGRSVRGQINSCGHYFCFVCIMEWSRIESRCPMCKQRFTTIRRPPKDGAFPSERIVNVPKRDQVYNGLGNASIGHSDPYQHVSCSVCNGVTDESLLLLCDLCDIAAHTYCVGLGATVPEGDWFCHDCTLLRAEHSNTEIDTGSGNEDIFRNSGAEHKNTGISIANSESENHYADVIENSDVKPAASADVSIFDIVHEELNSRRSHHVASSLSNRLSPPVVSGTGCRKTDQNNTGKPTELGARTLHHCRNVQRRIQALRENWNKLQRGSLSFTSSAIESRGGSSRRHNDSKLSQDRSGQQQSSSFQDGLFGNIIQDDHRSSFDVNKAWKMMKIAKSIPQTHRSASRVHQASKHPSILEYASKQAANTSSSVNIVKKLQSGDCDLRSIQMEKRYSHHHSNKSDLQNHRSLKSKLQEQSESKAVKSSEGLPTRPAPQLLESPSSINAKTQFYVNHVNGARPVAEHLYGASSSVAHEQGGSSCSLNLVRSMPGNSNSYSSKAELNTSSSGKIDNPERKDILGKGHMQSKARKDDDAKSEIQSLVKLNLKLLSREKKLEIDKFKEVARLATHTILAACGLEHRKSGIRPFPITVVCSHTEDIKQTHKSTMLPNSCRECFFVFVKDVVQSIMFEELDHANTASRSSLALTRSGRVSSSKASTNNGANVTDSGIF